MRYLRMSSELMNLYMYELSISASFRKQYIVAYRDYIEAQGMYIIMYMLGCIMNVLQKI